MSSMLADVVSSGTAAGARAAGFKLPAGGKTGTTDDYSDAWFVGYTPHLVAGVWFGLDTPAPIMSEDSPARWRCRLGAVHESGDDGRQAGLVCMPADVEKVAICRLSGARATDGCRHAIPGRGPGVPASFWLASASVVAASGGAAAKPPPEPNVYEDYFPLGAIPPELCPLHGAAAETAVDTSRRCSRHISAPTRS